MAVIAAALGALAVFAVAARWALVVINRVERDTVAFFPAPSSKAPTG